ncbi:MAG: hypothetical protein ACQKHC_01285 [Candidatus Phytoplasma pruni]|uniref:hypothetical protein n=1 Tax=Milkweed yellows phytoplasma TaxID=208434 RepID=UPI000360DAFB|nr:hypothetical protein [Milkweed yellows phytoplasma]
MPNKNALKTKLMGLKCEKIEIIKDNETAIKEIHFEFEEKYLNSLQILVRLVV